MRRGDTDSARRYFRSSTRVFNLNGTWYFATREGDEGPFIHRELADMEAGRYADERLTLCGFQESREAGHLAASDSSRNLSILPKEETVPLSIRLAMEAD
jgi:hypothetical protein